MTPKKNNDARMFHLSYDAKITDDNKLKANLTWSLLYLDINAILTSPVLSTILIESEKDFEEFEALLIKKYKSRMYYVLSEVQQEVENYIIDIEPDESEVEEPYVSTVESMRTEILKNRESNNR